MCPVEPSRVEHLLDELARGLLEVARQLEAMAALALQAVKQIEDARTKPESNG